MIGVLQSSSGIALSFLEAVFGLLVFWHDQLASWGSFLSSALFILLC